MKSGWYEVNDTLFWISLGISGIGSITGGIACWANSTTTHNPGTIYEYSETNPYLLALGFWIFFGGLLITIFVHSFWGMMLDLYRNVDMLVARQSNNVNPTYNPNNLNDRSSYNPLRALSRLRSISSDMPGAPPQPVARNLPWQCSKCGETNPAYVTSCPNCGTRKNKKISDSAASPNDRTSISDPSQSAPADAQNAANAQFPWQCPNCGRALQDYVRFCPSCGTRKQ